MSWSFETDPDFQEQLDWVERVRHAPRWSPSTS